MSFPSSDGMPATSFAFQQRKFSWRFEMVRIKRRTFISGMLHTAVAAAASRGQVPLLLQGAMPSNTLATDPRRPQYHLLPAANWMNDPNGPIYFNGYYHMFYQYNPNGAFWGDMHWGHAISPDMIHWRHLPVALAPTPGGPDAEGCFSGTAVVQDGRVVFVYTGVRSAPKDQATINDGVNSFRETQCLAIADNSSLTEFTKLAEPVIAAPPAGMKVTGFRDPSPWRQGDVWYMVVGSGIPHQGGAVLLYRSKDLRTWDFVHVVAGATGNGKDTVNPVNSGDMWECPDLFALGNKHVLIYSTEGKAHWQTGVLDEKEMKFHAEKTGTLDIGAFYAPKTQLDNSGNRILWGWIPETRPLVEYKASGWAGMMSLPRVLSVADDGELQVDVHEGLKQLRKSDRSFAAMPSDQQNERQIAGLRIEQCCGEILCSVRNAAAPFELSLCDSAGTGASWLTLKYDPQEPGKVWVDSNSLSISRSEKESLRIHLYIDGSVIELFLNERVAYTKRFYYSGDRAPDVCLKWTGRTTDIEKLTVWQLKPISTNRLTS
jgi:beta-fructofuranosidase